MQKRRFCNEVRDITVSILNEVCKDVRKEPPLIQLTGETFEQRTANTRDEARLDVSALGFWITGRRVFCDGIGSLTTTLRGMVTQN